MVVHLLSFQVYIMVRVDWAWKCTTKQAKSSALGPITSSWKINHQAIIIHSSYLRARSLFAMLKDIQDERNNKRWKNLEEINRLFLTWMFVTGCTCSLVHETRCTCMTSYGFQLCCMMYLVITLSFKSPIFVPRSSLWWHQCNCIQGSVVSNLASAPLHGLLV